MQQHKKGVKRKQQEIKNKKRSVSMQQLIIFLNIFHNTVAF